MDQVGLVLCLTMEEPAKELANASRLMESLFQSTSRCWVILGLAITGVANKVYFTPPARMSVCGYMKYSLVRTDYIMRPEAVRSPSVIGNMEYSLGGSLRLWHRVRNMVASQGDCLLNSRDLTTE